MAPEILLVFCTCPDEETGSGIAERLVVEKLAACVNRLPGVRSLYLWQDKLEQDVAKRCYSCFLNLPEIIATPVTEGLTEYLQWVGSCTALDD